MKKFKFLDFVGVLFLVVLVGSTAFVAANPNIIQIFSPSAHGVSCISDCAGDQACIKSCKGPAPVNNPPAKTSGNNNNGAAKCSGDKHLCSCDAGSGCVDPNITCEKYCGGAANIVGSSNNSKPATGGYDKETVIKVDAAANTVGSVLPNGDVSGYYLQNGKYYPIAGTGNDPSTYANLSLAAKNACTPPNTWTSSGCQTVQTTSNTTTTTSTTTNPSTFSAPNQTECQDAANQAGENYNFSNGKCTLSPKPTPAPAPVVANQPQATTNAQCGVGFIAEGDVCRNPTTGATTTYSNILLYNTAVGVANAAATAYVTSLCQAEGATCVTATDRQNFSRKVLLTSDPALYKQAVNTIAATNASKAIASIKVPTGGHCQSTSECDSGLFCGRGATCQAINGTTASPLTTLANIINAIPGGSSYISAYNPANVTFGWQRMGFTSLSECVQKAVGYQKSACNTYNLTSAQAASSIQVGSELTAAGALVVSTAGAGASVISGGSLLSAGGSVLTSTIAIQAVSQTGSAVSTCITNPAKSWNPFADPCIGQSSLAVLSLANLGAAGYAADAVNAGIKAVQAAKVINTGLSFANAIPTGINTYQNCVKDWNAVGCVVNGALTIGQVGAGIFQGINLTNSTPRLVESNPNIIDLVPNEEGTFALPKSPVSPGQTVTPNDIALVADAKQASLIPLNPAEALATNITTPEQYAALKAKFDANLVQQNQSGEPIIPGGDIPAVEAVQSQAKLADNLSTDLNSIADNAGGKLSAPQNPANPAVAINVNNDMALAFAETPTIVEGAPLPVAEARQNIFQKAGGWINDNILHSPLGIVQNDVAKFIPASSLSSELPPVGDTAPPTYTALPGGSNVGTEGLAIISSDGKFLSRDLVWVQTQQGEPSFVFDKNQASILISTSGSWDTQPVSVTPAVWDGQNTSFTGSPIPAKNIATDTSSLPIIETPPLPAEIPAAPNPVSELTNALDQNLVKPISSPEQVIVIDLGSEEEIRAQVAEITGDPAFQRLAARGAAIKQASFADAVVSQDENALGVARNSYLDTVNDEMLQMQKEYGKASRFARQNDLPTPVLVYNKLSQVVLTIQNETTSINYHDFEIASERYHFAGDTTPIQDFFNENGGSTTRRELVDFIADHEMNIPQSIPVTDVAPSAADNVVAAVNQNITIPVEKALIPYVEPQTAIVLVPQGIVTQQVIPIVQVLTALALNNPTTSLVFAIINAISSIRGK